MREVIKYIKFITGDFVICGSMALYLHNIIEDYNPNEIDIIVDLPNRDLDYNKDFTSHTSNRFGSRGWSAKYGDVYIDVYNKPLPEYDEVVVDGLKMNIKTIQALKEHYLSLDIDNIDGHERFKQKLLTRIDLFK